MPTQRSRRRAPPPVWCARLLALASVLVAHTASAYVTKQTSYGDAIRWPGANETFVIDPSVEAAVPGGAAAVAEAAAAWSGIEGAPVLKTTIGPGGGRPAVDGQNTVIYAPDGFGPAGNALAVTLVSYDDVTGDIVDTDIVINGKHRFAVLAGDARAASGAKAVSTEGGGGDDAEKERGGDAPAFDLQHVIAHEVGHALGLGDVQGDSTVLMYAMSFQGDAAMRGPTADEEAGIAEVYGGSEAKAGGCGGASVGGGTVKGRDAWWALGMMAVVIAAARREDWRRSRPAMRQRMPLPRTKRDPWRDHSQRLALAAGQLPSAEPPAGPVARQRRDRFRNSSRSARTAALWGSRARKPVSHCTSSLGSTLLACRST